METLYAYLAGAIDIDGRVSINRALGYRRRDGQRIAYYTATIALSDTDPLVPDLLQVAFPARRLEYEARNRKQLAWHMWEAVGQKAHEPLVRLLPYMRIKCRQAELALSLIILMEHDKVRGANPLTHEQERARLRLYEESRRLNASRPKRIYR
jgi:hypothetical protein